MLLAILFLMALTVDTCTAFAASGGVEQAVMSPPTVADSRFDRARRARIGSASSPARAYEIELGPAP